MKGDAKVIEYLNAALRSELTAINQYWVHYRLQKDWGLGKLAAKSRAESIEEMNHADKLIDRIIFLEGHPNLQKLDPLRIGRMPRKPLNVTSPESMTHAPSTKRRATTVTVLATMSRRTSSKS